MSASKDTIEACWKSNSLHQTDGDGSANKCCFETVKTCVVLRIKSAVLFSSAVQNAI